MYQQVVPQPEPGALPPSSQAALAFAQAIIPGSGRIPAADAATVSAALEVIEHIDPRAPAAWLRAQQLLDKATILSTGRAFQSLSRPRQQALLARWEHDPVMRVPLALISLVYKFVHFDRLSVYETMGGRLNVVNQLEQPRWLEQVTQGDNWVGEEDIEAEVIVIGTGAGGAVVGRELVEKGLAVVFLEEGHLVRRDQFSGSSRKAHLDFYRAAFSVGNAPMPVFIGRMVGGSTAVNGGTCFEAPPWVLEDWCESLETDAFAPEVMAPYFRKVLDIIQAAPSDPKIIGPMGELIRRGCEKLGWSHFPILRNAPGCDGQGFCDFGCRTDARRSTNISYIPPALERGAMLISGLRAERLMLDGQRAMGVECRAQSGGTVRVRAPTVVFSGGAIPTPLFLMKQGICNSSSELGKNLSLHPSGGVAALMEERIDGASYVPQGYGMDQFTRDGVLITGASPDYNYAPLLFSVTGERLMNRMDNIEHIANFGVLIRDTTRGRVRWGPAGYPLISYNLNEQDIDQLKFGMLRTMEMLRLAGAKEVYPAINGPMVLRTDDDFRAFRERKLTGSDLLLTSYHPLGTCRMGRDSSTSVVNLNHEAHDIKGLYIVDGSTVPGPLGVNPQVTIMAMATRAADCIAKSLS
ncbi:MAG: GMC family oxidoreductase [Myxococcales bacterium]|nr:GMC family oxidoreductase [Myxococcales bacterium]